jgi:maltose 6'-phosphate phosphatase
MAQAHPVRIVYAENIISRLPRGMVQELAFMVRVDNYSYHKRVTIHWQGEDGVEQTLPATYYCTLPDGREYWLAKEALALTSEQALPGNIQFWVKYEVNGDLHHDPLPGHSHHLDADCGVVVYRQVGAQLIFHEPELQGGKETLPIEVAVRSGHRPQKVTVHWSLDRGQTVQMTRCKKRIHHWEKVRGSAARNPNRYGWEIWTAELPIKQAYRIEYSIECETEDGVFWDHGYGRHYEARRSTLRVLTLNLHCRQEADQEAKFATIARAIEQFHIDLVCLQEVAEDWNNGAGDWASNTAHAINKLLPFPYHIHHDYSHRGFEKYREGLAILSRHEFTDVDSRYVSSSTDVFDIHARRVLMAQVHVPYFGPIQIFNCHLSWPDGGFKQQFERLHSWIKESVTPDLAGILVSGDFNIAAGSPSYQQVVNTGIWQDQYLKVRDPQAFAGIFEAKDAAAMQKVLNEDGRIDYIWLNRESALLLMEARELFTDSAYGKVSDHSGYYAEFELK